MIDQGADLRHRGIGPFIDRSRGGGTRKQWRGGRGGEEGGKGLDEEKGAKAADRDDNVMQSPTKQGNWSLSLGVEGVVARRTTPLNTLGIMAIWVTR